MALLEWHEEYSVGVVDIDHEHREMIELINEVYDQLQNTASGVDTPMFLGEIFARISAHFALEEQIMRTANYPEYAAHKEDHEKLLDELRDFMDDYETSGRMNDILLGRALSDWFGIHFRTFDARLHQRLG